MAFLFEDDLDSLMTDSPHTITIGGVTKKCWFDESEEPQQDSIGGGAIIKVIAATVKTSDFPSVAVNDSVTITSASVPRTFTVVRPLLQGDGALTRIYLGV